MSCRSAAVALLAATLLAGCGTGGDRGAGSRPTVVATTTQLGDFARAVGGDDARVVQVLRPNSDPHGYEPRPKDVVEVATAQVVLESGDGLDPWIDDVVKQSGSDATRLDLGAAVPERLAGEGSGPEASRYDPHWWHDPRNAEAAVAAIRDALVRARPAAAVRYRANAAAYLLRLRALDAGIAACIGRVPVAQRKLVTDHDAFGYFAARYGIEVVGAVIPSRTTEAQPSARSISELTRLIRAEGVKAVFPESSLNAKLARAVAQQTGATATSTLYGDTLGPPGSSGAAYLAMEQANAAAMVDGFTGTHAGCPISGL